MRRGAGALAEGRRRPPSANTFANTPADTGHHEGIRTDMAMRREAAPEATSGYRPTLGDIMYGSHGVEQGPSVRPLPSAIAGYPILVITLIVTV
jgi:hypothetical protein